MNQKAFWTFVCSIPILFALLIGATVTQTVQLTITGTSGATAPAEAQAAGMTLNVLNSDFTQAFSSDCNGTASPQWFHQNNPILLGDCQSLIWPATDQGGTVLKVHYTPGDIGSRSGRQGIVSENLDGSKSNNYPLKAFVQVTGRVGINIAAGTELNWATDAIQGPWINSGWQWFSQASTTAASGQVIELDHNEFHGSTPNGQYNGSLAFNWGVCGGSCKPEAGGPNTKDIFPQAVAGSGETFSNSSVNPSQKHVWGSLITIPPVGSCIVGTSPGAQACLQLDSYVDHVHVHGSQTVLTSQEALGRWILIDDVTSGCVYISEGDNTCLNIPVTAAKNSGGVLSLSINDNGTSLGCSSFFTHCWDNTNTSGNDLMYVTGVGGNVPNGTYHVRLNSATDVQLTPQAGGSPVAFSGTYTGVGTINPIQSIDHDLTSYQAWVPTGCTSWATTQC